jgi:hypothetical protein
MDGVMVTRYQTAMGLFCLALLMNTQLDAFSFFGSSKLTPEQKIEQLQRQQIDAPLDPEINYNLGVALYRVGRFDEAKTHFARTLAHARKGSKLATQTFFNKANAGLKNSLSILPPQWEKQGTIEPQILETALANITEAIGDYQSFLVQKPNHTNAQANKKYTEGIKKKLEKKKQEQQQKQQEKDQKDQQQPNDASQKPQEQQQKGRQEKQSQEQNKPADKKNGEKKEDATQQEKQQAMSSSQGNEEKQAAKQEAAQIAQQKESSEDRRMRAMLENLQSEESARQKALMQRQTAAQSHQPERGQKPW